MKRLQVDPTFVQEQLAATLASEKGMRSKNWSFIRCPFHNERTPSLQVWHDPINPDFVGSFKCRGCGVSGHWSKLAEAKGYEKPERRTIGEVMPVADIDVSQDDVITKNSKLPEYAKPFTMSDTDRWRGFSGWFLDEIGAKPFIDTRNNTKWVWLPVRVNGATPGHIRGRWEKQKDKPSYLNAPGQWSKNRGLFMYDYVRTIIQKHSLNYVILCEGPRDAMRLCAVGLPALAILGVHTWSTRKIEMLSLLGVTTVFIVMDADTAGREGEKLLKTGIDARERKQAEPLSNYFKVRGYKGLPEGVDPGAMKRQHITALKEWIKGKMQ